MMGASLKKKYCITLCRVSTARQAQQGESLEDQDKIASGIADRLGYTILKRFQEQYSGRKERPIIKEILAYIKNSPVKIDALIFRSIDRLTRKGSFGYEDLKHQLAALGVQLIDGHGVIQPVKNTLEHLGVEFDWSKTYPSEITELVLAQQGKHEITQILTRMIGAEIVLVREGYMAGGMPLDGYISKRVFIDGKKKLILAPDPERTHFFIEMYKLRAEGAYSDAEIANRINAMGFRTRVLNKWSRDKIKILGKKGGKLLTSKLLQRFIQKVIYCGVSDHKWLQGKPIKLKYPGLVSIDLFNKANRGKVFIQENKDGTVFIHHDYEENIKRLKDNPDFPFKRIVLCPLCEKPFTASFVKSKSGKKVAYYHCGRKHKYYGIRKDMLEKAISTFMISLNYNEGCLKVFETMLLNKYREKERQLGAFALKASINVNELEIEKLQKIEAYTTTSNPVIREALEDQINKIQEKIISSQQKRDEMEIKEKDIYSFIRYVKYLMEHPSEIILNQKNPALMKSLFGLVFDKLPTYEELVNGTPKLSLPYRFCELCSPYMSLFAESTVTYEKLVSGTPKSSLYYRLYEQISPYMSHIAGDTFLEWNTLQDLIIKWNLVFKDIDLSKN